MIENLLANLDIIIAIVVTFILTITIILIPIKIRIKYHYAIALTRIETLFKNSLNMIKSDIDSINSECINMYSMPRISGRNDSQKSAIRRIEIYLKMIKLHINQWNKNNE